MAGLVRFFLGRRASTSGCRFVATAQLQPNVRHVQFPSSVPSLGGSLDPFAKRAEQLDAWQYSHLLYPRLLDKHFCASSISATVTKEDIINIVQGCILSRRTPVTLFQRLKVTIISNIELWSAPDLAHLCYAWTRLGFMHEDLCVAMARRIVATAHTCNAEEICWLTQAYAVTHCTVDSVTRRLWVLSMFRVEEFTPQQLCLHVSSFARLQERNNRLLNLIADRLVCAWKAPENTSVARFSPVRKPRDFSLAAHSFAKLGFNTHRFWAEIDRKAVAVIRDFTARDLALLAVACAQAEHRNEELLRAVSVQVQHRMAQFDAESLVMALRALAFLGVRDMALFTRVVVYVAGNIGSFRPVELTTLLAVFAAVQVHSDALFELATAFIVEEAHRFTRADRISAQWSYMALGWDDEELLSLTGVNPSRRRIFS